jgi:GH25 family lysozyme M1 (1,4-beta-N-acetylmuramidase)
MSLTKTLIQHAPSLYSILPALGTKGRAVGPDLSHWKVSYDPDIATSRADFAITKATEGTTFIDYKLAQIWNGIAKLPIRGLFHYQRSELSWRAQADHFLRVAAPYQPHILALDVEPFNNTLDNRFFQDSYRIIQYLKESISTPTKVMLYTNKSTFENYLYRYWVNYFGRQGEEEALTIPLWYAQYWTLWSVDKEPSMPKQRATWDIWQITEAANSAEWGAGSAGVDLNVYNGTPAQMAAWLELSTDDEPDPVPVPTPIPPLPDEPEPEAQVWQATVTSETRVVVRAFPKVEMWSQTGQYVYKDKTFRGRLWSGNGYVWLKITDQPDPLQGKWVAVRNLTGTLKLITLERIPPVEPIPTPEPAPQPGTPEMWMVPHDLMRFDYDARTKGGWRYNPAINGKVRASVRNTGKSMPEVYKVFTPQHSFRLSPEWVKRVEETNWELDPAMARSLIGTGLAFCNGTWGVFDQCRLMGGWTITGTKGYSTTQMIGDVMRLALAIGSKQVRSFMIARQSFASITQEQYNILHVDTLRADQSPPPATAILEDPTKWGWCVSVRPDGKIGLWHRKGADKQMHTVRMLIISAKPITLPLNELLPVDQVYGPQWMPTK